ncbi:MAG: ATP-binding protein [Patescibacteria group bacterium]|nr:ATP-binding protein [Patescibacteria group bacterium]
MNKDKIIKIAFVGTSSTGKTTLLWEYKKKMSGNRSIVFVHEAARDFFKENPHITERFAKEIQGQVQSAVLAREQEAHNSGARVIICDRSVIDAVVYVRSTGDRKGAKELLEKVKFWIPTYTKFLLLNPVDVKYEKDEVRQEDENTRQAFHKAFLEFFKETRIPYELLSGSIEQRIKRVDRLIGMI